MINNNDMNIKLSILKYPKTKDVPQDNVALRQDMYGKMHSILLAISFTNYSFINSYTHGFDDFIWEE